MNTEGDCVICGKWPEKDRWALPEMIDSLPLQEIERICDKCLESFWRGLPHAHVPPKQTSH
jgi:hypothetical protein